MQSMTGYGSVSQDTGEFQISIRIRSVNHRFLDVVLRMPEDFRPLEIEFRERLGKYFQRGRIELRLDLDDRRDLPVSVHVSKSWLAALQQASEAIQDAQLDLDNLRLSDVIRFPDAIRFGGVSTESDDEMTSAVLEALDGALEDLAQSRAREGAKLRKVLEEQLDALAELVTAISNVQEAIRKAQEERLRRRIQDLLGDTSIEEGRLEQEVAILAERADVREELDRLESHLGHFREAMGQSGAIGKKLDFIAQEISRELTTLGAKCRQAGVMQSNVDAKLICEQIREQIQNIE